MPRVEKVLVNRTASCVVLTMMLMVPLSLGAAPAHAQDIFGFFRALTQPATPAAPALQPYGSGADPLAEEPVRKLRPRPKPIAVEATEVKKPLKPRTPGEMDNPVPALLADGTLEPGDMVMFPDGLRVFMGKPGDHHKLTDFKPLAQAKKSLSPEMRKLVANLLPSENPAWSADGLKARGKLAANIKDVETTGSTKRARR